jgi:uncharacterized protein YdhG (YjbR/CyaY superfamily)
MGDDFMKSAKKGYKSIDQYIRSFPEPVQKKLVKLRDLIREQAPQAQAKISYQMPTFFLNGNLVHFAAYSKHIGFYPTSSGIRAFRSKLSKYKHAKGSVRFSIEEPLPVELIRGIVKFRAKENMKKK